MNYEKLNWEARYLLSLNETQTIKNIMDLFDCGRPKAIELRDAALRLDTSKGIVKFNKAKTVNLLKALGYDDNYFYKKMMDERKVIAYVKNKVCA